MSNQPVAPTKGEKTSGNPIRLLMRIPVPCVSRLITSGPYRISRNPMYVGLVLSYLGVAGLQNQMWPVVLFPLTIAHLNWIVGLAPRILWFLRGSPGFSWSPSYRRDPPGPVVTAPKAAR